MMRSMVVAALLSGVASAQMAMHKPPSSPSTSLKLTGLGGGTKVLLPADLKQLPHVSVTVHNAHSNRDESYSGVPVKDVLAAIGAEKGDGSRTSTNMQVVIAGATDHFHVVLTLCDINPECRTGQAIVADEQDHAPLTRDGAFKLILTEDRKPARWVRNLDSLTVRAVSTD